MARILPPSVFRREYTQAEFKPTQTQRVGEQWASPEGIKTAVGITDVVGGTIADVATQFARKRELEESGDKIVSYDEALARVAAAKTHKQRQRAYDKMASAWDRPGSGRLSRRWSGGPSETMTTQYKRMLSPLRYPAAGGSGRGDKITKLNYKVLQDLKKQIRNPGSKIGRDALAMGALAAGAGLASGGINAGMLDQNYWVADPEGPNGFRIKLPNEEQILQTIEVNSPQWNAVMDQSRALASRVFQRAAQLANNPEEERKVRDSTIRLRALIGIGSQASLHPTAENIQAFSDLANPLVRSVYDVGAPDQYHIPGKPVVPQVTRHEVGGMSMPQNMSIEGTAPHPGSVQATPAASSVQIAQPTAAVASAPSTPVNEVAARAAVLSGIAARVEPTAQPQPAQVVTPTPATAMTPQRFSTPVPQPGPSPTGMMSTAQDALQAQQVQAAEQEQAVRAQDEMRTMPQRVGPPPRNVRMSSDQRGTPEHARSDAWNYHAHSALAAAREEAARSRQPRRRRAAKKESAKTKKTRSNTRIKAQVHSLRKQGFFGSPSVKRSVINARARKLIQRAMKVGLAQAKREYREGNR